MANEYGDNDLRRLEREAEVARARLHDTIAEIKDPQTMEAAKQEVKDRAEELKDQVLGYIRGARDDVVETGRTQTNEFSRKLQRTALENPLPIMLIGAGIGWHLYKKPPITTALLGAGIYGLMKNWNNADNERLWRDPYDRSSPRGYVPGGVAGYGYDEPHDVSGVADRMKNMATNLSYGAESAASSVRTAIGDAAERVRGAVSEGVEQARDKVSEAGAAIGSSMKGAGERAGEAYDDASNRVHGAAARAGSSLQDARSTARGAARNLAQSASDTMSGASRGVQDRFGEAGERARSAIDRAARKLPSEHRSEYGMLMVLAGAGVLAGGMLRQSETGKRWVNEASELVSEGYDKMRHRSQETGGHTLRDRPNDEWRSRGEDRSGRAGNRHMGSRASDRESSVNPLVLSAIGIALGALLGGVMRQPQQGRSWGDQVRGQQSWGDMARDMRDTASETLQKGVETVKEQAGNIAETVTEAVKGEDHDKLAQRQRERRVKA